MLSRQRTTKVLIRLRRYAGWSAPLLFSYGINRFFSWRSSCALRCIHVYSVIILSIWTDSHRSQGKHVDPDLITPEVCIILFWSIIGKENKITAIFRVQIFCIFMVIVIHMDMWWILWAFVFYAKTVRAISAFSHQLGWVFDPNIVLPVQDTYLVRCLCAC